MAFTFGGKSFPISLDTFNLGLLEEGGNDCVGGVMAASGLPGFIVGDVFLQNVYTGQFLRCRILPHTDTRDQFSTWATRKSVLRPWHDHNARQLSKFHSLYTR